MSTHTLRHDVLEKILEDERAGAVQRFRESEEIAIDTAELTGIVAYLRNMNSFDRGSTKAGDPARGQLAFEGKGGCLRCHRVGAQGALVAPDLSDIGAIPVER